MKRKGGKPLLLLQWGRGFSAAETLAVRRCDVVGRVASMGPRLFSRGNPLDTPKSPPAIHASMGPRLFSRGNWWDTGCRLGEILASMGPRLFSRGNTVTRHVRNSASNASMGPRLFSRGNGKALSMLDACCE